MTTITHISHDLSTDTFDVSFNNNSNMTISYKHPDICLITINMTQDEMNKTPFSDAADVSAKCIACLNQAIIDQDVELITDLDLEIPLSF